MVEAAATTSAVSRGLDDQAENPNLKTQAAKEKVADGSDNIDLNAMNKVNTTTEPDSPVVDARSPTSPGAKMRAPNNADVLAMQTIANIKVKVQAILGGIQMSVSQLSELKQGELVSLDSNIGEAVDIIANGQLIARGEIVVIEGGVPKFGITLTEII